MKEWLTIFSLHQDNIADKLENPLVSGPDSLFTPYLAGVRGSIKGNYKGNLLQHELIVLQDSLSMYQILVWMPAKYWEKYENDMMKAVNSLRPLNTSNMP